MLSVDDDKRRGNWIDISLSGISQHVTTLLVPCSEVISEIIPDIESRSSYFLRTDTDGQLVQLPQSTSLFWVRFRQLNSSTPRFDGGVTLDPPRNDEELELELLGMKLIFKFS